jgi:membrane associated rhomboid family serine protease
VTDAPAPGPNDERTADTGSTLVACPRCGALNAQDFDRCVRCTLPLGEPAEPAGEPAGPHAPQARVITVPVPSLLATKLLLGMTSVVFAGQLLVALGRELSLGGLLLGGNPVDAVRFGALAPGSAELLIGEPWRLLSAVFVHFGILHFGLNMLGLWYLGRMAEPAIGPVRFTVVYVATGLLGFATTTVYFLIMGKVALTAGASGALFGVMGLILGVLVRRRDPRWKIWATQAVLFSVLFGFAIRVANNSAHLGGLAVGVLFGLVMASSAQTPAPRWQRVLAVAGLLGSAVSLVLAQLSPLWRALEQALPG